LTSKPQKDDTELDEHKNVIDRLHLEKYVVAGFKPFKERVKFVVKQAYRCRNLNDIK